MSSQPVFRERHAIWVRWAALTLLCGVTTGYGLDFLDGQKRLVWSPNGRWLVFNWPLRNDLFVVEADSGRAYRLQPVGDYKPEAGIVVAPDASGAAGARGPTRPAIGVPSPGTGKLTWEEWSPDSRYFLYRYGKNQRAIYDTEQHRVTEIVVMSAQAPWTDPAALRVDFENRRATDELPAAMVLRVRRPSGEVLKEIEFTQTAEMSHLNAMRFRPITFLSHRGDFVVYPRLTEDGWCLMRARVSNDDSPTPIGSPGPDPPYEWKLTADDEAMVVVERDRLVWGRLRDWANASAHRYGGAAISAAWSGSGRYLAWQSKQSLFLCRRDGGEPVVVSDYCAPRFWGWRGDRLLFGHSRASRANLFEVNPEDGKVRQILTAHAWQVAPQEISLSPNGERLACLVHQFDGNGVGWWELWVAAVRPDATWELIFAWRS